MATTRIQRFEVVPRLFHVALILCFTTQAATGLARMLIETAWGVRLAGVFGGYERALEIHKSVGGLMLIIFGIHILWLFSRIQWKGFPWSLFNEDSIVPRPADIGQFVKHVLWMLGLSKSPKFDRWGYWEKFDYWAVFWGMAIIGTTGLILFNPVSTSTKMPGWSINVAFWIHRIEALLAIGHVFIIHFFIAHVRRHNFPMDTAMFEGSVDMSNTRHEKPGWLERLEKSGKITAVATQPVSGFTRVIMYLFGIITVIICLILLINSLINASRVTW